MEEIFWDYSSNGPDKWPDLCPDYHNACEKYLQSPIALNKNSVTDRWKAEPLAFDYSPQQFLVQWYSHTFHYSPLKKNNRVKFMQEWYTLEDLHFHLPCEHSLNGKSYPIEFHLVHYSKSGHVLVIALLFEHIFSNDKNLDDSPCLSLGLHSATSKIVELDLQKYLPQNPAYYLYDGSFTTPPCIGNVHWVVFSQLQDLYSSELLLFVKEIGWKGNNRPVQKQLQKRIWYM